MVQSIYDTLLESLQIQAERFKDIISNQTLTPQERKDFDTEIREMHTLLSDMTNTSAVFTVTQLKALEKDFQDRLVKFDEAISKLDLTTININLTPEQIEVLKGQDGKSFTYEDMTQSQKQELADLVTVQHGENGKSAYQIWLDLGHEGTEQDFINSLSSKSSLNYGDIYENTKDNILFYIINTSLIKDLISSIDILKNEINLIKNNTGVGGDTGTGGDTGIVPIVTTLEYYHENNTTMQFSTNLPVDSESNYDLDIKLLTSYSEVPFAFNNLNINSVFDDFYSVTLAQPLNNNGADIQMFVKDGYLSFTITLLNSEFTTLYEGSVTVTITSDNQTFSITDSWTELMQYSVLFPSGA